MKLISRICAGGSCREFPNSYCKDCSHGLFHGEVTYRHQGRRRITRIEYSCRFGPSRIRKDGELFANPIIMYPTHHPFWPAFTRWRKAVESGKLKTEDEE